MEMAALSELVLVLEEWVSQWEYSLDFLPQLAGNSIYQT
jgi:hypothetical protein